MKKRLHRNIVEAIALILREVFIQKRYADRTLEQAFKDHKQWGARDRKFIAETVYEIVRWWRRLNYAARGDENKMEINKILSAYLIIKNEYELPEWLPLWNMEASELLHRYNDPTLSIAIKESIPDWLEQMGHIELGNQWHKQLNALNHTASIVLRVNTLKIAVAELRKRFNDIEIETQLVPQSNDALILPQRINIFQTPLFKEGLFEIQDLSSQAVAPFLHVTPGMRVIDACAGAGGKSLHLAALMKNKGRVVAMDIESYKLKELEKRSRRNGINIIDTRWINSTKIIKRQAESADRLLLDVPCSGLGVLRRNPDAKWNLSSSYIHEVKQKQQQILHSYSKMLKPGGKMVYATCSILPSENQNQVKLFLEAHSNFILEEDRTILPSEGYDGFYMARLKRL